MRSAVAVNWPFRRVNVRENLKIIFNLVVSFYRIIRIVHAVAISPVNNIVIARGPYTKIIV